MQTGKLDQANLRTNQLDFMIDWYTNVPDMRSDDRADFPFPGAWMYAGNAAVVHMVGIDGSPGIGSETELKPEHFALSASGRARVEAKLQVIDERYQGFHIPSFNIIQINIWDQDGNHIHIDFPADE